MIDHGEDGYVCRPDDTGDLTQKMVTVLSNQEERIRLGQNGLSKVRSQYSWEMVAKKYMELYLAALEN